MKLNYILITKIIFALAYFANFNLAYIVYNDNCLQYGYNCRNVTVNCGSNCRNDVESCFVNCRNVNRNCGVYNCRHVIETCEYNCKNVHQTCDGNCRNVQQNCIVQCRNVPDRRVDNCRIETGNDGVNYMYLIKQTPFLYFDLRKDVKCLSFNIRSKGEFHLTLSKSRCTDTYSVEFHLGQNNDRRSSIVKKSYNHIETVDNVNERVITDSYFLSFWLSWHDGIYKLGRRGYAKEILKWCDYSPSDINFFGIRAVDNDGEFYFEDGKCC